ncbi:MAG: hypothetical protein LKK48_06880 [Schleiferilactobacillus perolens]|nr:hypothetical protein [Schleiferilactobacillus perolens]MCI2171283.1 hypothetical protein [Schleiferilactobacillus perolens]
MWSNRRCSGAQLWKPHSALFALMWLGVFETAHFAGSKRRHSVPAPEHRRLRSFGTGPPDILLFLPPSI